MNSIRQVGYLGSDVFIDIIGRSKILSLLNLIRITMELKLLPLAGV